MPTIKIKCIHCNKRYSGDRLKIESIRACPRCKETGEWWTRLYAPDDTQPMSPEAAHKPVEVSSVVVAHPTSQTTRNRNVIIGLAAAVLLIVTLTVFAVSRMGASSQSETIEDDPVAASTASEPSEQEDVEMAPPSSTTPDIPAQPDSTPEPSSPNAAKPNLKDEFNQKLMNELKQAEERKRSKLRSRVAVYREAVISGDKASLLDLLCPWQRDEGWSLPVQITDAETGEIEFHESGLAARVHVSGSDSSETTVDAHTNWVYISGKVGVDGNWFISEMEILPLVAIAWPNLKGGVAAVQLQDILKSRPALYRECHTKADQLLRQSNLALAQCRMASDLELKEYHLEVSKKYATAAESVNNLLFRILADDDVLASALIEMKRGGSASVDVTDWTVELSELSDVVVGEAPETKPSSFP